MNHVRLFSTATAYGVAAFSAWYVVAVIAWHIFPYPAVADQLSRVHVWFWHVLGEKIGGMLLGCIAAFFAARAYRPSWKLGFVTGVLAALAFQLLSFVLYVVRFGLHSYMVHNRFFQTMISAISSAALFSFIAVWPQYRREVAKQT